MTQRTRRIPTAQRRQMMWMRRKNVHTGSLGFTEDVFSDYRGDQGTLANPPGLTIVRTIVDVYYRAVATDDTIVEWYLGLIVAPIDDSPPNTGMRLQPGDDWMLNQYTAFVQQRQEGTPTQNLMLHRSYDLSGQRKVQRTERTLWIVSESLSSDTIDYAWSVNTLVKLP